MAETADSKKTSVVKMSLTAEEKEWMLKWMEFLSFSSQRQMVKFMFNLGGLVMEASFEDEITPQGFANALYTIAARYLNAEIDGRARETVREFIEWRKTNLPGVSPQQTLSGSPQRRQIIQ